MRFSQLYAVLRGRSKIAVITFLLIVSTTLIGSLILPKTYSATATVVLNYKGTDSVTGTSLPPLLMPTYMATQIDIIESLGVAIKVVDVMGLAATPETKDKFLDATGGSGDIRNWVAEQLLKRLSVTPSRESSVIGVTFSDRDASMAVRIANEFVNQYQLATIRLKTEPMQQAASYLSNQVKALREKLEASQSRLSKYQQEKGIVSTDIRNDVESTKLNELSMQLVAVQGQLTDVMSRQKQLQGGQAGTSPDIVSNPLIQNLKASIAMAEAKMANLAATFEVEHPQYQRARAELNQLRAALKANIDNTSSSIDSNIRGLRLREATLQAAVAAQKERLLEVNRARDEMAVLLRESENAQRAYDTSIQRFNQTNLEGNANQSDVSLLQAAVTPAHPSSPRLSLNLAMAVFLGTLLGIGLALLAELFDRRVRSAQDLAEIGGCAVLGSFEHISIPGHNFRLAYHRRSSIGTH